MAKRTLEPARARASARGDAVATLVFGAALVIASVFVALVQADVPKYLIGFGTFLSGVVLLAWGSAELDRVAGRGASLNRSPKSRTLPDGRGTSAR